MVQRPLVKAKSVFGALLNLFYVKQQAELLTGPSPREQQSRSDSAGHRMKPKGWLLQSPPKLKEKHAQKTADFNRFARFSVFSS